MTSLALGAAPTELPERGALFRAEDIEALNVLRPVAARVRCAARLDPLAIRTHLSQRGGVAAIGYAEALFRLLTTELGRRPVVYAGGERSLSPDEAWLLRLLVSARDGDEPSLNFLIRSRIAPMNRVSVAGLARKLASTLDCF